MGAQSALHADGGESGFTPAEVRILKRVAADFPQVVSLLEDIDKHTTAVSEGLKNLADLPSDLARAEKHIGSLQSKVTAIARDVKTNGQKLDKILEHLGI